MHDDAPLPPLVRACTYRVWNCNWYEWMMKWSKANRTTLEEKKEGSIRSLQWRVIHSHILLCVQHDFSISHTTRFLFAALFQGIWISRVLVRLESGEATAAQAKIYDHRRDILYILNAHAKATKKEYWWNTMHDLEVNISSLCAAASNTVLITCVFVYCYASLRFLLLQLHLQLFNARNRKKFTSSSRCSSPVSSKARNVHQQAATRATEKEHCFWSTAYSGENLNKYFRDVVPL